MKRFAALYAALDASTATNAKIAALKNYFVQAPAQDAAWAIYFLAGGKPRQAVNSRLLREIAQRAAGVENWLFEESYQAVGDLAETIAHILPPASNDDDAGLAQWVIERIAPLRGQAPEAIEAALRGYWDMLDWDRRFLLTKLIGGGFRVGVSKLLVIRALAEHAALDAKVVAQRMMGMTDAAFIPSAERFAALLSHDAITEQDAGQPYPFFLAHQLDEPVNHFDALLGPVSDWLVEWKYDGIRGQIIKRQGQVWIWSRGEELVTDRFPEIVAAVSGLPDGTVLDGEILVVKDGTPAPFALLQQRIGRKTLTKKVLADAPAGFFAYDVLEHLGTDVRALPQHERRAMLETLHNAIAPPENPNLPVIPAKAGNQGSREPGKHNNPDSNLGQNNESPGDFKEPQSPQAAHGISMNFHISPSVQAGSWQEMAAIRDSSRARGVEGFMLKRLDAAYGVGRTKADGTWWKWKIDPMSVDCVLVYAQRGHGRRASLYTDYTFAVWDTPAGTLDRKLVTFAKAYSGLTDEEFARVDAVIRKTTLEKFGPIRSVTPTLVFELGFEGINASPRHKSGIAVRFPRMLRWRTDKPIEEADSIEALRALLPAIGSAAAGK